MGSYDNMNKKDVAEKVISFETPYYICKVKDCKKKFKYRIDYLMHLAEDHTVNEMLKGFNWKIEDDEVVINEKNLPGGLKYDKIKEWIDEFSEELVYEKVYFFVENWETAKDIVDMVKKKKFISSN